MKTPIKKEGQLQANIQAAISVLKFFLFFIFSLTPFLLITKQLFLTKREVWLDESIFHSVTKTFMETGRLTTDIYGALAPYIQKTQFMYPPLFFWVQSIWFRFFGDSIESIRMLSVMGAIGVLIVAYLIIYSLTARKYLSLLIILLLSLDYRFSLASRMGRVEIITLLFMSLSVFFYLKGKQAHSLLWYLFCGLTAGLTCLGHFMGYMILGILGSIHIMDWKKIKKPIVSLIFILLPALIVISLWLITFLPYGYSFVAQVSYQAVLKGRLTGILQEQLSGWHGILSGIIFLGIVYVSYRLQRIHKTTRVIFVGLVISFLFSWFAKDEWYVLYFRYFLNISVTVGLILTIDRQHKKGIFIYVCIVIWLFLNSIYQLKNDVAQKYDYHAYAMQIARMIPEKSQRICLFVNPDPYFEIKKQKKDKILHEYIYGSSEEVNHIGFYNNCDVMIFNKTGPDTIFFPSEALYTYYMTRPSYSINVDHPLYPTVVVVFNK